MAGPFDYTLQVANPFQSALQGYQSGLAVNQAQQQQQAQQLELQQKQAALQAQQRTQEDLYRLSSNPRATGADYAAVMTRNPQLSKQLSESWSTLNTAQQQSKLQQGTQAYAAIQAGRPDLAEQLFIDQATAARNSGDETTAKQAETMAQLIKQHPESAKTSIALSLSSHLGPEKFAETFAKLGGENRANAEEARKAELQPSVLAKSQADAQTAITGAKFAESKAVKDLQLTDAQIKKMSEDTEIARQNSRIAAMNAATARAGNELERQKLSLQMQEAISKRDDKVREKTAAAQGAAATVDNALNTVERILKSDSLDNVLGTIDGRMPGITGGQADVIALIDTLGSQAFMAKVAEVGSMSGLTEKEGDKLQNSITNLSRVQTPAQFRVNANEFRRLMLKARDGIQTKYGVDIGKPDTPAAPGARPPLSSFQR